MVVICYQKMKIYLHKTNLLLATFIVCLAQRKFEAGGYEFIGMNCVIDMPPIRLGLDKCGDSREVGSKAVYNFLRKYQPRLSLHGHIHESPEVSGQWYAKLGNTLCIQPGQLNGFTYVTIDLSTMKFDRVVE